MNYDDDALRAQHLLSRTRATATGCLEFLGCVQSNGYARATVRRKTDGAHRHVFRLLKGLIPDGMDVCHECDNRKCINPDHLFLGTRLENMRDAAVKGRTASGLRLPQTKLTDQEKARITELAKQGIPYKEIASQFDICRQHAGYIAIKQGVRRDGISK